MENLKPYHTTPPEVWPTQKVLQSELVDCEEEFKVEDIIAHRLVTADHTNNQSTLSGLRGTDQRMTFGCPS